MRSIFKFFSTIITCGAVIVTFSACVRQTTTDYLNPVLEFNTDGEFTILQITDTHEWMGVENGTFSATKMDTLKPFLLTYMDSVLDQINPDLVVLTGDNIFPLSAFNDILPDTAISVLTYKAFAEYFKRKKQYWTMTFGNHDAESIQTKQTLLTAIDNYDFFLGGRKSTDYYKTLEISRYDENGYNDDRLANFSIPVYNNNEIAYNIFLLDSGSYSGFPAPAGAPYRYILDQQTEWYISETQRLNLSTEKIISSIIFTHIPLLEFNHLYSNAEIRIGTLNGLSPSDKSSSILNALTANGTKGFFTGHDHDTSITFIPAEPQYSSIVFGVTPHADGISYSELTSPLMRSRVIKINPNGDLMTYIHTNEISDSNPDNVENGEFIMTGDFYEYLVA
ncbi:MAG: metallophosphoesterase [Christensenellaceae bacterium]|jgi:hypothetical protein|nr:metallophosphoesterase [Christensenellaceae bacterium]